MNAQLLRRLFENALRTSLLSPLVLAGCGPSPGGPSLNAYEPLSCDEGMLVGLAPSVIPDVVQLRNVTSLGSETTQTITSSVGTPCATASDVPACLTEFEGLFPEEGFRQRGLDFQSHDYLATTLGSQVESFTTIERLRAFLGVIDTPKEALLLVFAQGLNTSCGDVSRGGVRVNTEGGFDVVATSGFACGEGNDFVRKFVTVSPSGELTTTDTDVIERGSNNCVIGRRPEGLECGPRMRASSVLGRHLAEAAQLEAASVDAFLRMREELRAHGAPRRLLRTAVVSAREEVQHARVTGQLALRHGGTLVAPRVKRLPPRPLLQVALENRTEGCVRETWGALVAQHQALCARDPQIRKAMETIAADETRHAAFSWAVDRWASARLGSGGREALREARDRAVAELRKELSQAVSDELVTQAGIPGPDKALAMFDGISGELWG